MIGRRIKKSEATTRSARKAKSKQDILEAALTELTLTGWSSLSLREVAKGAGYSPAAIYEYFPSREDLLGELLNEGFGELKRQIEHGIAGSRTSRAAVGRFSEVYCVFAFERRELYDLMHQLPNMKFGTSTAPENAKTLYVLLIGLITDLASPKMAREMLEDHASLLWATLHGLVSLNSTGRIKGGAERTRRIVKLALITFLAKLDKNI